MFRRVHRRLAFLCAGITIVILLVMSVLYLYISEQGLKKSHFFSFQNHVNTMLSNIEQQETVTHQWLARAESDGQYLISILDNGTSLLHSRLRHSPEEQALAEEGRAYGQQLFASEDAQIRSSISWHDEFIFESTVKGEIYYGCQAFLTRGGRRIDILILSSTETLNRQIHRNRILFMLIDGAAVFCLFLFAWHFTRKLLFPIEESRQRQTEFIAAASHELRTPLAVVFSSVSACRKASEEEKSRFMETIGSECMRMSRLVDDMLLLARADSHALPVRKRPVELDTLVLDTYEAFRPVAAEKNICFTVELPEQLTPPFSCDRDRMVQLLEILLHNAISYTPEEGRICLRLICHARGKGFEIQVEDTGIGVPDEEKEKIFRRFYRGDKSRGQQTKKATDHFGLGLSIAAEIVHAHRGKIFVRDGADRGSVFVCKFI